MFINYGYGEPAQKPAVVVINTEHSICHFSGENYSKNDSDFFILEVNKTLSETLCIVQTHVHVITML